MVAFRHEFSVRPCRNRPSTGAVHFGCRHSSRLPLPFHGPRHPSEQPVLAARRRFIGMPRAPAPPSDQPVPAAGGTPLPGADARARYVSRVFVRVPFRCRVLGSGIRFLAFSSQERCRVSPHRCIPARSGLDAAAGRSRGSSPCSRRSRLPAGQSAEQAVQARRMILPMRLLAASISASSSSSWLRQSPSASSSASRARISGDGVSGTGASFPEQPRAQPGAGRVGVLPLLCHGREHSSESAETAHRLGAVGDVLRARVRHRTSTRIPAHRAPRYASRRSAPARRWRTWPRGSRR
jgi:hypothetical protein